MKFTLTMTIIAVITFAYFSIQAYHIVSGY